MTTQSTTRYRLYCINESKFVYKWITTGDTAPTTCPTDCNHSIQEGSISAIEELSRNESIMLENTNNTNGVYKCDTFSMDCPANQTTEGSKQFPLNISVMRLVLNPRTSNIDDIFTVICPRIIIGVTVAEMAPNALTISTAGLDPTAKAALKVGYYITIISNSSYDVYNMGRILTINANADTITLETPQNATITAGSYIQFLVKFVDAFEISSDKSVVFSSARFTGAFLPINSTSYVSYTNNTNTAKRFTIHFEYLY